MSKVTIAAIIFAALAALAALGLGAFAFDQHDQRIRIEEDVDNLRESIEAQQIASDSTCNVRVQTCQRLCTIKVAQCLGECQIRIDEVKDRNALVDDESGLLDRLSEALGYE